MGKGQLDLLLAMHCAPTFVGMKAASMVAMPGRSLEELRDFFAGYEQCFACKGLKMLELRQQKEHVLLLIYRPTVLERLLRRPLAREILKKCGYPENASVTELLTHLQERMEKNASFPHEIGLFLGYPPHDVAGFIIHGGQNFLCSGFWKVYDNAKAVQRLFSCYDACIKEVCARLQEGESLQSMIRRAA